MEDSKFFRELPDSQYGEGVMLDEYQGTYSLVSARKAKDGKIYMSWCYPQGTDRKPREKGVPWKVSLGTKEQALRALQYFGSLLGWEQADRGPEGTNPGDIAEDGEPIPF
jgi:hypothetical protein